MKKGIILGIFILFLVALGGLFFIQPKKFSIKINYSLFEQLTNLPSEVNLPEKAKTKILPKEFKFDAAFVPQAPFAIWDDDHNHACEEAAILMVNFYLEKKELTPEIADEEILAMIDYQRKNWQGHFDLEASKVAKLAEEFYGYKNTKVKYDISILDIKREIVAGNPVILPCAGRKLGNPYYRQPGPLYHMLVAIGYDEDEIIVNDPGTKRGKNFSYKYEVLLAALHEWNGGDVQNGRSAMIILQK